MLTIDGSKGEGGGQVVRTSLALSVVTGQAVEIHSLRAGRKRPGLMRQHLTAVRAAQQISDASVSGAELGSRYLKFEPNAVRSGQYNFRIGTAGSTTLVFQTVLPALMLADTTSTITLEGGTHNPLAPSYDYLARVYLPLLAKLGPRVDSRLIRPGFFPAGGGQFSATIHPCQSLDKFELLDRGPILQRRVTATVAHLPQHIAERECRTIASRSGWEPKCFLIEQIDDSAGPGNLVTIEVATEHVTELFIGFGQRGVRAETVANRVWTEAKRYLDAGVPVGEHLADQLLLPLAISAWRGGPGGCFRTLPLSQHATTQIEIIKAFLKIPIEVKIEARRDTTNWLDRSRPSGLSQINVPGRYRAK